MALIWGCIFLPVLRFVFPRTSSQGGGGGIGDGAGIDGPLSTMILDFVGKLSCGELVVGVLRLKSQFFGRRGW